LDHRHRNFYRRPQRLDPDMPGLSGLETLKTQDVGIAPDHHGECGRAMPSRRHASNSAPSTGFRTSESALQDGGSGLPYKGFILHQKNCESRQQIVCVPVGLTRHVILQFQLPDDSSSNRLTSTPCEHRGASSRTKVLWNVARNALGIYLGALKIVRFGSSTILRTSLGAASRNAVSGPSASTSPRKTNALPAVVAYTGTAVTRSSGAFF
jgi:hypothetical protein